MKKAQIQIMENIFVILIIIFLLVIALVFSLGLQKRDAAQKAIVAKDLEQLKKARILDFLPELQCSDNNYLTPDCYDLLKLESFTSSNPSAKQYYKNLFGKLNITVMVLDPNIDAVRRWEREWRVYDYNADGSLEYSSYETLYRPVTVRDPVNMTNYFGWVILGVYG